MIQHQLKLRLNSGQEAELKRWLVHLTSVYNWALSQIGHKSQVKTWPLEKVGYSIGKHGWSEMEFRNLLAGTSKRLGIPSQVIQGTLTTARRSWVNCWKGRAGQPKFKGIRNPLSSIPFPSNITPPKGNRIHVAGMGMVRFHGDELPSGTIKICPYRKTCIRVVLLLVRRRPGSASFPSG